MSSITMTNLGFFLNEAEFYEQIRMRKGSRRAQPIERILEAARNIPKPKVLYRVSEAKIIDAKRFTLDGVEFTSEIGVEKISKAKYIFPNIVTAGSEIENYCLTRENVLDQYIIMELCNFACEFAREAMHRDILIRYGVGIKDCIYPGEDGFRLETGKRIFDLFENVEEKIGVTVTDMGLTTPSRTAYAICFG
ncbi:hypothetical protein [Acetobacterium woodii]|uniref:Uncharacterized protein n=1 Tax=Acetobacterium woodii (strain ATCC 29683 / DSM 1030 / JCM 2381 / KCTC 1655 / WB1) TaxID=931626 RepID=H6LD36_ACEWD|nr:hypothetical protein [Acetobacterium woodii]AFA47875.1 hypothetical protein Awo_c10900 [Acetobacterium woodii DSM 1030]